MSQPEQGMNRNTKIALGALAILAMAAALYWYFSQRSQPVVTDETPPAAVQVEENGAAAASGSETEIITEPGSIATVPPLEVGNEETATVQPDTENTEDVKGINPDTPLARVPALNPFKPLRLAPGQGNNVMAQAPATNNQESAPANADAGAANYAPPPSYSPPSFSEPSQPVSIPRTSSSASGSANSNWEFGSDPVVLKQPAATGSRNSSPAAPAKAAGSNTGTKPASAASAGKGSAGSSAGQSNNSNAAKSPSRPASPVPAGGSDSWDFGPSENPDDYPPAVMPGSSRPAAPASAGQSTAPSKTNQGSAGQAAAPAGVVVGLPKPGLPQSFNGGQGNSGAATAAGPAGNSAGNADYVREYGAESVAAPDNGTQLSRVLNTQDYRFTGAVLGPTNTAIFKSTNGFNVLKEGEKLPGTDVVVKSIQDNRVTLALGNETVTLDLESLDKF